MAAAAVARMWMVTAVVVGWLVSWAASQAAPAPEGDCDNSLTALLPCYDFVSGSANNVSKECCSGLSNVRTNSPRCLCTFLGANSSAADLGINTTRALELPALCGVDADPSDCLALTPPTVSPPSTPPSAAPVSPAVPPTASTPPSTTPVPGVVPPSTQPPVSAPPVTPTPATTVPPPPPADCNSLITQLTPCLNFVSNQAGSPSTECCARASNVLTTSPSCLCALVTSEAAGSVNFTRALELPQYCSIDVPPEIASQIANCTGGTPTPPSPGPPEDSHAPATLASPIFTAMSGAVLVIIANLLRYNEGRVLEM